MYRFSPFLLIFLSINCFSQVNQLTNYYVASNTLNVRSGASIDSTIILKLNKYDNIFLWEIKSNGWSKIIYKSDTGYVVTNYIKKGRSILSTYSIRVGAVCKDGTRSSATGRGACSHHGGVSYWLTKEKTYVRVIDE